MRMWIPAMLAVGILLIVRDMAKFLLKRKRQPVCDMYPQRARIEGYAASFQKLGAAFADLPECQEQFSHREVQEMMEEMRRRVCSDCAFQNRCWQEWETRTSMKIFDMLKIIEEGNGDRLKCAQGDWLSDCGRAGVFVEELRRVYLGAREALLYRNRLIASRAAVAEQYHEVARLIRRISGEVGAISALPAAMEEKIRRGMRKKGILVRSLWMAQQGDEKWRLYLTMRTRSGQCVTMREAARCLTDFCGAHLVPAKENRSVLGSEWQTVLFTEAVRFRTLFGAAKMTCERETVSGDNYACAALDGQFVLCLSDGMGSGVEASRESTTVVELLEDLIAAGFSRESAARMVNAALVLERGGGMFSSLDVSALDLYSGVCEFVKAGAAATFIRRSGWVESISSASLPVGLCARTDLARATRKLYDGDYLIMMTDGVLDALPANHEEEIMKEIILQADEQMPARLAGQIMDRVLAYSMQRIRDDMTILVAGVWTA